MPSLPFLRIVFVCEVNVTYGPWCVTIYDPRQFSRNVKPSSARGIINCFGESIHPTGHDVTRVSVARELGISQDGVSQLEQRSDLLHWTLRKRWRRWADASRSSRGSPTGPRSNCPASPTAKPVILEDHEEFDGLSGKPLLAKCKDRELTGPLLMVRVPAT